MLPETRTDNCQQNLTSQKYCSSSYYYILKIVSQGSEDQETNTAVLLLSHNTITACSKQKL